MDALPPLTVVDVAALILIGIGGIQGFFRGFSGELARLIGVVVAFLAGALLHEPVGGWISGMTRLEPRPAQAVVFVATVLVALAIMIAVRIVLKRVIKLVFADGFDKAAGILAGLLRMSILVCLFFLIMNMIPVETLNARFGEQSAVGRFMVRYVPTVERTLEQAGIVPFWQRDDEDRR